MKDKKNKRHSSGQTEQRPLPASDRLIEALQGAVNRARDKRLATAPDPSSQHLNPFTPGAKEGDEPEERAVGRQPLKPP